MLTVIGLGRLKGDVTETAKKAIAAADYVAVRTARGAGKFIKADEYMDEIYDSAESYDDANARIAERLKQIAAEYSSPVYCTDGDGFCDGAAELYEKTEPAKHIAGVGGARPASTKALIISAYDLTSAPYPDGAPIYLYALDSAVIASEAKLYLMKFLPFDARVKFLRSGEAQDITLEDLDRMSHYGADCAAFIYFDEGFDKSRYGFGDLCRIIERLTAEDGCPWDKVQTHESIRVNMIEEAYEAVDAVDSGDIDAMREEFGDVLLQSVLNCDIAKRHGEFDMGDVITDLCRKLYTRHTHIFGANHANDASEALGYWEKAKAKEKNYDSVSAQIKKYPDVFPSALKAQKIYKKLFKTAVSREKALEYANAALDKDIGEYLFWCVAAATASGKDSEIELNGFCRRLTEASGAGNAEEILSAARKLPNGNE